MTDIYLVPGVRTPFVKGGGPFVPYDALALSAPVATAMAARARPDFIIWGEVKVYGRLRHRMEGGQHLIDRQLEVSGAPDAAAVQRLREIAERTPVTLALKAGFTISTELTQTADAGSAT